MDRSDNTGLDVLNTLNWTELRQVHKETFGIPTGASKEKIIAALATGTPAVENPIARLQVGLMRTIDRYKQEKSWVPECHGTCCFCPDGMVLDCFNDNEEIIRREDMEKAKLNPYDRTLTWEQIEADEGALKDRSFITQFISSRGLVKSGKDLVALSVETGSAIIRGHFFPEEEKAVEKEGKPAAKKSKKAATPDLGSDQLTELKETINELRAKVMGLEVKLDFLACNIFLPNEEQRVGSPFQVVLPSTPAESAAPAAATPPTSTAAPNTTPVLRIVDPVDDGL